MPVKIEKPPHGAPCNSCGMCCEAELCPLGTHIFDRVVGSCPALESQEDGRKICGLMQEPAKYVWRRAVIVGSERLSAAAAYLLGAGTGCDGRLENEPTNEAFFKKMFSEAARNEGRAKKALKLWGIE